ncbi:MAG: hypothetical protein ACYC66_16055, partial [Chloroflexota bacterium]
LPDPSVNALALSPSFGQDLLVAAATGRGVAVSRDGGDSWQLAGAEGEIVLSLDVSANPRPMAGEPVLLAGPLNRGLIRSEDGGKSWTAANQGLKASFLTGLALSPGFGSDGVLFAWGRPEGAFRSEDGGRSWQPSVPGLDAESVSALAVSPSFDSDGTLYAATSAGVYRSLNRGTGWEGLGLADQEVKLVAVSPIYARRPLVVAATRQLLYLSWDAGANWSPLEAPDDGAPVSMALALDSGERELLLVATWREPSGDARSRLRVWSRVLPDSPWRCLFYRDTTTAVVSMGIPDSFDREEKLFIASGDAVYRAVPDSYERTREGVRPLWLPSWVGSQGYPVLALATTPDFGRTHTLLAACGNGIYRSGDEGARWERLAELPGGRAPVAVVASPDFAESGTLYALAVGGQLWRWEPGGVEKRPL